MKLHNLKPAEGATKKVKRIGRGEASGHGGTSTKGNKGGQARTGYKRKLGHEGGQMPIQRRTRKRDMSSSAMISPPTIRVDEPHDVVQQCSCRPAADR